MIKVRIMIIFNATIDNENDNDKHNDIDDTDNEYRPHNSICNHSNHDETNCKKDYDNR